MLWQKMKHRVLLLKYIVLVWLLVLTATSFLYASSLPSTEVTLNKAASPISVLTTDSVSLSLALDAGLSSGVNADWWLVQLFNDSQASFNPVSGQFESGLNPGLQTGLSSFPLVSFLSFSGLEAGTHQYCFAVDTIMNGEPDWDKLYYDCATVTVESGSQLIRSFTLPVPLFSAESAWRQTVSDAAVLSNSADIITFTYRVLRGDISSLVGGESINWPNIVLNHDDYSVPVFAASSETGKVVLCDYEGSLEWPNQKYSGDYELGDPIQIPLPLGRIRPAGPQGIDADGWLVLYQAESGMEYDFWQATTSHDGQCQSHGAAYLGDKVLEAGYADFFDISEDGSNPDDVASARAVGTPLLAGLLLPEDIASGVISHPIAFAIPGPQNLSTNAAEPASSDYDYPASTTETDHYSQNLNAMIAGQRIRLKRSLVDDKGVPVNESSLAPVTQMFLSALREYGAIMVDNAGGFAFYAEDIHTGYLNVSDEQVKLLIAQPVDQVLAADKTKWQIVLETLDNELSKIPIAYGLWVDGDNPATAPVNQTNFEVVSSAKKP